MTDLGAREAAIVTLLERHAELTDPMRSGNGHGSGGLTLMPHDPRCHVFDWNPPLCTCAYRSVVELERLLRLMRGDRHSPLMRLETGERVSVRQCWWHVNAWYLTARWVMFEPPLQKGRRKQPLRLAVDELTGRVLPVRVARRERGARQDVALRGVSWLADGWDYDRVGAPNLPVVKDAA